MQTQMNNIQTYINNYNENITASNAQQAVDKFLKDYSTWKNVVGHLVNDQDGKTKDGEKEYGNVLIIFSVAISEINSITEGIIDTLFKEIQDYESKVKYMFEIKLALYSNLGICWHKLGQLYDNLAIEAFKKYIFYQLTLSNHTSYNGLTCYSFRNCSKFLFQSLVNESLNLSSPSTFNDIFDCPIIELMNNDDEISQLIRKAYLSGVKVACFVKNEKLPYSNNISDAPITNDKKNDSDKDEYLNELMWAHYADSHNGICIRYKFPSDVTTAGNDNKNYVSYFKDVEYTSDLKKHSEQNSINTNDAFFAKGESWKYENELRLLYYNPTSSDSHISLPISNCIEAVYFGVKCSDKDKQTIKSILKGRKCISFKHQWTGDKTEKIKEEKDIEFYQMKIDDEIFGAIKAVKDNS
ncbi:Protein of unknown function [Flavobacterium resistens]|uniref:DUF2971 domain-containing protein n=1 Tax=Flavobacterium resistens TaxID=443612 RepID=A0A521B7V4_9FLAO|nr:DUF2971 domain-containing protein [Flavobacterium resistens]MRX70218.1 DUF2971 domain-containing protein [Flavobacterium resistens]SMO43081.1 Protein of unknown function [Flavobacterium resistens]